MTNQRTLVFTVWTVIAVAFVFQLLPCAAQREREFLSHNLRVCMYFEFVTLLLLKQCHCYCACQYFAVDCSVQRLWLLTQ